MAELSNDQFVSALGKGREAFHAEVTEFCLRVGERTPEDFLRHFSCSAIMRALQARPTERAHMVSKATMVHEKVAHKMSPEASGEALQIALDERVATPADIVRLFAPDDRQRYLERHALWAFVVEGEPWKATPANQAAYTRAKSYIAYILDRALENMLVSHQELVGAISVARLAQCLPKEQLGAIIQFSLTKNDRFTEADLVRAVPPVTLVEYVALDYLWGRVIMPLIAEAHDYVPRASAEGAAADATPNATPSTNPSDTDWGEEAARSIRHKSAGESLDSSPDASAEADDGDRDSSEEVLSEDEIIETEEEVTTSNTLLHKTGLQAALAHVKRATKS